MTVGSYHPFVGHGEANPNPNPNPNLDPNPDQVGGYHPFDGQGEADIETTAVNIRHEQPDYDDPVWGLPLTLTCNPNLQP